MINLNHLKKDFPILNRKIHETTLVYLDNAATSQKPQQVIDAITGFYSQHNANVHRGLHTLSEEATSLYENSRKKIANFIGCQNYDEIVFTSGTTQSLNSIIQGFVIPKLKPNDVILTTVAEHHSNLVPWQQASAKSGAKLEFVNLTAEGQIDLTDLQSKMNDKVKFVAVSHVSNVLGTIFPVKKICEIAHACGALVIVDGAQAVPHMAVNIQNLGCDFYTFSGHKMLGPTGIGILWGRKNLLEQMSPVYFGGGMIDQVDLLQSTWGPVPERFEAGTPNIAGAIGLAAAVDYLSAVGMENIHAHEVELLSYLLPKLAQIPELKILGPKNIQERSGLVSFVIDGIHSHDLAAVLDNYGVAVRSGHHCTMPLHKNLGINSSTRVSVYLYNTIEDMDALIVALGKALEILKR